MNLKGITIEQIRKWQEEKIPYGFIQPKDKVKVISSDANGMYGTSNSAFVSFYGAIGEIVKVTQVGWYLVLFDLDKLKSDFVGNWQKNFFAIAELPITYLEKV